MAVPPEVLLDRYFRSDRVSRATRSQYKGKYDLERLAPGIRSLLTNIQNILNAGLLALQSTILIGGRHPNFHFEYVDAVLPNALAFQYEGYSFIAVTMPLTYALWEACIRLSRSPQIGEFLMVGPTDDRQEAISAHLFATQLSFVVGHEFAHHLRGHVARDCEAEAWNEIEETPAAGCLAAQAREVHADRYAVYLRLTHLILGDGRIVALDLLEHRTEDAQSDEVLLWSFVLSVGAFFFARVPAVFSNLTIDSLTHPPQAARMNLVMHAVSAWCRQNRPILERSVTLDRYQALMRVVAEATRGVNGGNHWQDQTIFFLSTDGARYFDRLSVQVGLV